MTIDSVDESKLPSNDNNDSDVSSDEDDINLELENRTLQIAKKARLETDDSSSKKDTDDAQPDQKLIDLTGTVHYKVVTNICAGYAWKNNAGYFRCGKYQWKACN